MDTTKQSNNGYKIGLKDNMYGIVTLLLMPLYIIICVPMMLFWGWIFKNKAKIPEDLDEQTS